MMGTLLEDVSRQLEELDYAIEPKAEGIREASADGRWNFVFTEDVGGVLFRASIPTQASAADLQLYDLMNDLHEDAVVIRFYLDDDKDLALEAWWPPVDDSDGFSIFIQAWHHDISLVARHPDIEDLLE